MYRPNADGTITDAASVPGNQCDYGGLVRGNFAAFLVRQPAAERQAEGWYAHLVEGDVDQPTVDPITDALIVPRPVPAAPVVEADPLEPYAATIQAFSALWASLNIGAIPSDWTVAMAMLAEQPLDVQIKLLAFRVALTPVWDTMLERTN
jgi:hypothetical protein